MPGKWVGPAIRALIDLRAGGNPRAWGYRKGSRPCVEPTALAALALLSARQEKMSREANSAAQAAGDWLAAAQKPDGSLGVSEAVPEPGWGSPYGLLVWGALRSHEPQRKLCVSWLLKQAGETMPKEEGPNPVLGHDPTLVGWPWVDGTHSWVEPTALAVLALRREGLADHPRVQEGLRVIRDRAIVTGGWNCGNKATYGRILRPQPAPTGLALLALAHSGPCGEIADRAIDYLLETLPGVRAAESLAWGILGLRAWGRPAAQAEHWLAESFERVVARPDAAPRLALLLLASGEHVMEFLDEQ